MALAYRNFLHPPEEIDWEFAQRRQQEVRLGDDMGLVSPREYLESLKKPQP